MNVLETNVLETNVLGTNVLRRTVALLVWAAFSISLATAQQPMNPVLSGEMKMLDGSEKNLADYKGKVVLVVNVASRCGNTPQYSDLQKLYDVYKGRGLVILGFPCNQFGGQEPGTDSEIAEFCESKYGVNFDMFSKIEVNGADACPLYKSLTSLPLRPVGKGNISWNFEKFLIGRDGKPVARFSPGTKPSNQGFVRYVEEELSKAAP